MNDDWTKDIKKLMDGYEVKAPDGLLEEVKRSLATASSDSSAATSGLQTVLSGTATASSAKEAKEGKADSRQQPNKDKAKIVPLRRYRWIAAAAAVAVVGVTLFWKFNPKDQIKPEIATTSSTSTPASSTSTPTVDAGLGTIAQLSDEKVATAVKGSVSQAIVSATNVAADVENIDSEPVYKKEQATGNVANEKQTAKASKERKKPTSYHSFDNYDYAYEPSAKDGSSWTVGAYYGGASSSGNSEGMDMPYIASDAAPYGIYPADMATATLEKAQPQKKAHHKQPIKAGVSIGYRINNKWSVQTGVTYSYLSADFTSDYEPKETQKLHYVGIPLTASYNIVKSRKAELYVTAGGEVEKLVKGKISTENNEDRDVKEHRPQWSVKAAVGGAYHFTPTLSVFVEPGVSHHFDNHSGVDNIYKDRPTNFSMNMGFRVNINDK